MITLRCSSLPLVFACRPAIDGDLRIDERNEAADLGSAAHEAMEAIVAGRRPDLDAIASRWTCDRNELGRLSWQGGKFWEQLAPSYPDCETEISVRADVDEKIRFVGHVDWRSRVKPTRIALGDWKTGRADKDFYAQLAGYAACELLTDPELDDVVVSVGWLRTGEIETYVITRPILDQWLARLRLQLTRSSFSTGRHCEFCPRSHSCPAVKAKAAEGVAILTSNDGRSLEGMSGPEVVELYRRARLVAKVADAMVASIRLHVVQNGPQDSGDGKELAVVEESGGRDIDVGRAWDVIQARLPDADAMTSVLKISATALDDAVAKAAGRGNGAAAKRELAAELEAAGAVKMKTIVKLSEKRKTKEIT